MKLFAEFRLPRKITTVCGIVGILLAAMATAEQTAADDSTRGILPSADEMIRYAEHHLSTKEELGISQYGSIVDPLIPVWRDDLNILIISSNDPEKPSAPEATTLDMLDY
ncbi:MAG TPA: hypothetical protein VM639_00350, partial [Dongiaceae bacterium]|nr:hypothetical protein [Dongiaceae bacterium]